MQFKMQTNLNGLNTELAKHNTMKRRKIINGFTYSIIIIIIISLVDKLINFLENWIFYMRTGNPLKYINQRYIFFVMTSTPE